MHPVGNLSLSFDHRAVDGAYAAAFLAAVRTTLETRAWAEEVGRCATDAGTATRSSRPTS